MAEEERERGSSDSSPIIKIFRERKVADIPCYRSTFLASTSAGLAGTMAYFLFTSKMKEAFRAGIGVFAVVTLGYWSYCRYNYAKSQQPYEQLTQALQRHRVQNDDHEDG
ncbi:cytochrome c oxidase assembly protein COX20, mitochondrial isoform X3 [Hyalella azteca]|uniref:Cytochrome c oxidase assembly protein COX20, mitochondrial n=1 Tax=Hyalella azteca TaxID=294128 RepID=A0A8B7PH16_HYAAZ|nr:cytochrome c oxidase assembly protein COX20, mitochondrial isoform X1 [Hyalella azteca]XP_018025295.1 cytochrome c oxidase assembly protein COX20, mitochondrial isoform X2 [Hyalella azteca]XP_018025296.1 cytochrome c oxidase assembly protein COX20, mitochondrial isoform X3 [Hyalella azteca]